MGIDHLGSDFNWTTEVFSSDPINDGNVETLIFKGGGDPYITIERLKQMVIELLLSLELTHKMKLFLGRLY